MELDWLSKSERWKYKVGVKQKLRNTTNIFVYILKNYYSVVYGYVCTCVCL